MTELSPEARELLAAARESFSPDAERLTAVRAAITTRTSIPPGQPVAPGGGAALKGAGWGAQQLVGVGLLVAVGAGVGVLGYQAMQPERTASPAPAIERTPAPASGAAADIPSASASNAVAAPLDVPASDPGDPPAAAAPERRPAASTMTAVPQPRRDTDRSTAAGPPSPAPGAIETSEPPPAADGLAQELPLIGAARAALRRGDPARALALLDRHRASFPRGKLLPERLVTRVLALCKQGRVSEARAAAAELQRVAPRSSYPQQIRASCVGEPGRKTTP